jgi:hypothetical protein
MLQSIWSLAGSGMVRKCLAAGTVLAGVAGMPSAALAHHHGFHIDLDVPVAVADPVSCDSGPGRVWVEPVYQTVTERQWVDPVYQTVIDRVWVPATTTSQVQRVYVPNQYSWQDVVACDAWGRRYVRRQQVLVCAAHYESRQVVVAGAPGHYEDVQHQQLVCEGHWQDVQRQEIVTPGHWDVCAAPVVVTPPVVVVQPRARLEFRLPF